MSDSSELMELVLADGFEEALLGYVERFGQSPVALYDREKCIQILMQRDQMKQDEAVEFFEFNTLGAWVGNETPAFATLLLKPKEGAVKGE
tara:strand:- start:3247 stop:3519 length:273 start_codon:yes stop_codon:yes gene_type:complete